MEISERREGDSVILCPSGRIDNDTSAAFQSALLGALTTAKNILVDLEKVEYVSSAGLRALNVLVAEDNKINQLLAQSLLKRSGHQCTIVTDGLQAVTAVQRGAFDVVLMDVHMPELDGFEATRRIRALPGSLCRIPIIALTADALEGDRKKCIEAGMDDYLSKPIDFDALRQMLERWGEVRTDSAAAAQ